MQVSLVARAVTLSARMCMFPTAVSRSLSVCRNCSLELQVC